MITALLIHGATRGRSAILLMVNVVIILCLSLTALDRELSSFQIHTTETREVENELNALTKATNTVDNHDVENDSYILRIPETIDKSLEAWFELSIRRNFTKSETPNEFCRVTSQIMINTKTWILQSYDAEGRPKTVGGDEYYITYTKSLLRSSDETMISEEYVAAALITDKDDGTYQLEFVRPPLYEYRTNEAEVGTGIITVHFQYSCGVGKMAPPTKMDWNTSGATLATYRIYTEHVPSIRPFLPPTKDEVNGGTINLERYKQVIAFGDSIMEQLVQKDRKWFLKGARAYVKGNVGSELSTATLQNFLSKLQKWHGSTHFNNNTSSKKSESKKVAVILGSSAWDVLQSDTSIEQGELFLDHVEACRMLIAEVQRQYPHLDIYWKSPSAMHLHLVDCNNSRRVKSCQERIKYMSSSRAHYLHTIQKNLMVHELKVPYLDLYEAYYLSAHATNNGDGRHYNEYLNAKMLSWYFPDSIVQVQQGR